MKLVKIPNKRFQPDAKTSAFLCTRCAQTLTQKHSGFGAAEAGVMYSAISSSLIILNIIVEKREYPDG